MYATRVRPIFVTSNPNKRREAARILDVELESVDLDLPEIQALDVAEVAARKALDAYEALGFPPRPILVEDSGLIVEAWRGLPGALTKWFMSSVGSEGLCNMLEGSVDRSARAVCAVAVVPARTGGPESVEVFTGEVTGEVAPAPRGASGFGWDPIFIPDGSARTYAEMGDEKHGDSHRTRALEAARRWLVGG